MDETGYDERLANEHAWSPIGQPLLGETVGSRRRRGSVIGAYGDSQLVAATMFQGACNRGVVEEWLEEMLLPVIPKGSVVVMDNASFHKGGRIQELIEAAGCVLLYLPPYSPDFNPIEKCWAWVKARVKRVRDEFDTVGEAVEFVLASSYSLPQCD